MAVVERQSHYEIELARVQVECRWRVLGATTHSFPGLGSAAVEAAVDQAWMELYERGSPIAGDGGSEVIQRRWERLAYLRALNVVRERRRHPSSSIDGEPVGEGVLSDGGSGVPLVVMEGVRTDARVQEIVRQVGGDGRRWLEATLDDPGVPPRVLARRLGWDPEKLKSVARRTRGQLREFVSARASGAVCERRQAVMDAFAATHLAQQEREPTAEAGDGRWLLGPDRYGQVALHVAGCESCERAWREAERRLLRVRHALFLPFGVTAKLAGAGGALAAARHPLAALHRLAAELRMRVGFGVGRASAGSAAGGAGTAGVLAGKGAAVCAGALCATGMGTAALVGIPTAIVAPRPASHHHHAHSASHGQSEARAASPSTTSALATSNGQTTKTAQSTSNTRAGGSGRSDSGARAARKSARPVTPGDLIATSSATHNETASKATTVLATAASTRSDAQSSSTPAFAAGAASVATPRSSASACVPGSLGCR